MLIPPVGRSAVGYCHWPSNTVYIEIQLNKNIDRFELRRDGGSFRGWLRTIVRNKLRDHFARRDRTVQSPGGTTFNALIHQLPVDFEDEPAATEDQREISIVLRRLTDQVRLEFEPKTWDAFWLTTIKDESAREVAEQLNMTVGAVYKAKSRVLKCLRKRQSELDFGLT